MIGLNGAEVEGTAFDNGREPAPNVTIVALPDAANRGRTDLYRRTTTDRQGRFTMAGLAPIDYTFYAWDDVERGAWERPEFMHAFEGRGRFVRRREGKNDPIAKASVELRRIDAGTPAPYVATTTADGTFVFANVPAGQYRVLA